MRYANSHRASYPRHDSTITNPVNVKKVVTVLTYELTTALENVSVDKNKKVA